MENVISNAVGRIPTVLEEEEMEIRYKGTEDMLTKHTMSGTKNKKVPDQMEVFRDSKC